MTNRTEAPLEVEDLGIIKLRKKVYVGLLPSKTTSVLVRHNPDVQVSCVMPPTNFTINAGYGGRGGRRALKSVDIKAPTLIMSCGYADVPSAKTYAGLVRNFTLWYLDTRRLEAIYAKPYMLANLYKEGRICFGNLKPTSLKKAFNYYWASGFNSELHEQLPVRKRIHLCKNKRHTYLGHSGCFCNGTKTIHVCQCPKTAFHRHEGCSCATVTQSRACRCRLTNRGTRCECCKSMNTIVKNAEIAEGKKLKARDAAKLLKIQGIFPGCNCTYRHVTRGAKACACASKTCKCVCPCKCCQKTCAHGACKCACCREGCKCPCNCSASQIFYQHLEDYHRTTLRKQSWVNKTDLFCGHNYWAAPKGADGILISKEPGLLNKIPKKYWKKTGAGYPLVICLANRVGNEWHFESGDFKFAIPDRNIVCT